MGALSGSRPHRRRWGGIAGTDTTRSKATPVARTNAGKLSLPLLPLGEGDRRVGPATRRGDEAVAFRLATRGCRAPRRRVHRGCHRHSLTPPARWRGPAPLSTGWWRGLGVRGATRNRPTASPPSRGTNTTRSSVTPVSQKNAGHLRCPDKRRSLQASRTASAMVRAMAGRCSAQGWRRRHTMRTRRSAWESAMGMARTPVGSGPAA